MFALCGVNGAVTESRRHLINGAHSYRNHTGMVSSDRDTRADVRTIPFPVRPTGCRFSALIAKKWSSFFL